MQKILFGDEGSGITFDGDKYRVIYDSGEAAGSKLVKRVITKEQYERYIKSENEAYKVLLEVS